MSYQVTEKSTQYGLLTPHGRGVPHRRPTSVQRTTDTLIGLVKTLYPTGRAWAIPENSTFENFHKGLNDSKVKFIDDARALINSTLPDNDLFDEDDAALWEYRLGLITNPALTITERRNSILRKLAFPANIQARQHPLYIQYQLQQAGFNVFVHENTRPYRTPEDIVAVALTNIQHGPPTQHGPGVQHGSGTFEVVANSIDPDELYNIGDDDKLYATFFISGQTLEAPATLPESRQLEFRELVLKLKPAHTVAFLLINFV